MATKFDSLFDKEARKYSQFRPNYPSELIDFIVSQTRRRNLAWDCGTGSGQAARMVAEYFDCVIATDASEAQLEHAIKNEKVRYIRANAENSPLETNSVDLVTAANAVHWFNVPQFFQEATRVLNDGGVIAVWCYSNVRSTEPAVEEALRELKDKVKPYWPEPIKLVHGHYRDLQFPFEEIAVDREFDLRVSWTLSHFISYASTWSARNIYMERNQTDPLKEWGSANSALIESDDMCEFVLPLHLRIGRKR